VTENVQSPQAGAEVPAETPGAAIPPDARSLVATCFSLLAAKAWEALGLVPNPETKQIRRNLDDAQLAIDAAAALAAVIRDKSTDAERRELDTLLANLRINFVEQKTKAP
jgi:hypothetical protein